MLGFKMKYAEGLSHVLGHQQVLHETAVKDG